MFSIFNHTPNPVNHQQENNITARKPGLTTRKPFTDRKVNTNVEEASAVKSKQIKAVKEPELINDFVDFYSCSYKDTPETYNDIRNIHDDISSSSIYGNAPATPPPSKNFNFSEPDFMEIGKTDFMENYFDSIFDKIRSNNMLHNGLDRFDDSKMMDFDFDAVF